jgi:hypothetical protein
MKVERQSMWQRNMPIIRLALVGVFFFFVVGFAAAEYDLVRDSVRFLCISCLGLGG